MIKAAALPRGEPEVERQLDFAAVEEIAGQYEPSIGPLVAFSSLVKSLRSHRDFEAADAILQKLPSLKDAINLTDGYGDTCWMSAVSVGDIELMEWLEKHDANVGCVDGNGRNGLMRLMLEGTHPETMNHLIGHTQDPDKGFDIDAKDDTGLTALAYAIYRNRLDDAWLLLHNNASLLKSLEGLNLEPDTCSSLLRSIDEGEDFDIQDLVEFKLAIDEQLAVKLITALNERIPVDLAKQINAFTKVAPPVKSLNDNPDTFAKLQIARTCGSGTLYSNHPTEKEQKAMKAAKKNWTACDELIRKKAIAKGHLSDADIHFINLQLNKLEDGGKLRTDFEIYCGGATILIYLPASQVEACFNEFYALFNEGMDACMRGKDNPITLAAWAYQTLVSIHPYSDANGRTCRMVADYILQRFGLPPMALEDNVEVAAFALQESMSASLTKATEIVFEGVKNSYQILGIKI